MKLTCKWARPSLTVESQTRQPFVESYLGSRQDMQQLRQLEKLNSSLNDHLVAIKSFILQKRSKNLLKCFKGQILSGTKTTGNQCWNAQETHPPHDLSISKDAICSVKKQDCSTAYSTHISKVQVLSDQALFLCWAWIDQGSLHLSDTLLLYSQKEISFSF